MVDFSSPNTWQIMNFRNPLDGLIPKIPFSFFAEFWVRVTSGPSGSVSVGFWVGASNEPFWGGGGCPAKGLYRPPPPQTKARPPTVRGIHGTITALASEDVLGLASPRPISCSTGKSREGSPSTTRRPSPRRDPVLGGSPPRHESFRQGRQDHLTVDVPAEMMSVPGNAKLDALVMSPTRMSGAMRHGGKGRQRDGRGWRGPGPSARTQWWTPSHPPLGHRLPKTRRIDNADSALCTERSAAGAASAARVSTSNGTQPEVQKNRPRGRKGK